MKISYIEINNFKNVRRGRINIGLDDIKSSNIIGIYGQNGSGKTALIDALSLLKFVLCGQPIPEDYCNYINNESDYASFVYKFLIKLQNGSNVQVRYSFAIKKEKRVVNTNVLLKTRNGQFLNTSDGNPLLAPKKVDSFRIIVKDECLAYLILDEDNGQRMKNLISTVNAKIFLPKIKYDLLIGDDENDYLELLTSKRVCAAESRSFVFSPELLKKIGGKNNNSNDSKNLILSIIESIVIFGNHELFVINTSNHALISLNALPMSFRYDNDKDRQSSVGSIALPLDKPAAIPNEQLSLVEDIVSNMNIVLTALIPDLTISVKVIGTELAQDGSSIKTIELVSHKNSEDIPLRYESEGIKKIISILQLLIVVYNQPSITVAIDELDAGIFEYLLGELMQILDRNGKGQVIFTSHNLRPLEMLNKNSLYFTTTNPFNRYVRMQHLRPNNNQRDFYYKSILLGGQDENLYDPTDNSVISIAFRKAGRHV